ncbi:MAG: hypothetical protein ACOYZ6_04180 [Chloroflexota bacterium]
MDKDAIYRLMDKLGESQSKELHKTLLQTVVAQGEAVLPLILEYAILPPSQLKSVPVLEVINEFGYPANRHSLQYVASVISDPNDMGWELAFKVAKTIGPPIIPAIRAAIKYYMTDLDFNNLCIQGLCQYLEEIDPGQTSEALPELIELLSNGTDENYIVDYAILPIKRIGSPIADRAIPIIFSIIVSPNRSIRVKRLSIKALMEFDKEKVRFQTSLLEDRLLNNEPEIIDDIHKLFTWLKQK